MLDSAPATGSSVPSYVRTLDPRQAERRRLAALLDDLLDGRASVVEVAGDPGSGKTRLLNDLAALADRRGVRVLRAQYGESNPDLLAHAFVQGADEPAANPGDTRCVRLVRAAIELARKAPLVLLVDDFHWAGHECAELMDQLVRWPLDVPLLLVVAHRPRQMVAWLRAAFEQCAGLGAVQRIELGPLTAEESARMVGLEPDDARLRALHSGSGGNPLYLLALAAIGADTGPARGELPDDGIFARFSTRTLGEVAGLSEAERSVLEAVAVLGGEIDVELLASAAGVGYGQACAAAEVLVARDLLRPAPGGGHYCLRHAVLGRVLYQHMAACSRELAHWRAARSLAARGASAPALAAHLELCMNQAGLEEVRVLAQAAAEVVVEDPQTALRWCRVALHALRDGPDSLDLRVQIMVLLARTLGGLGWLVESREILRELLRLVAEPSARRGEVVLLCAVSEYLYGRRSEARALIAREVGSADQYPPQAAAHILLAHGILSYAGGGKPEAGLFDRTLRAVAGSTDEETALGMLVLRALREANEGRTEQAGEIVDGCMLKLDGLPDAALADRLLYVIALIWAEIHTARFADAERHLRRAAAIAEGSGNVVIVPLILNFMIYVDLFVGPLKAIDVKRWQDCPLGDGYTEDVRMVALALESTAALWAGAEHEPRALQLAEESFGIPATEMCGKVGSMLALASARLEAGDVARCTSVVLAIGGGPGLPHIWTLLRPMCFELLCAAAVAVGSSSAEDWAAKAEAAAHAEPLPHQRAFALVARGHLARRRGNWREAARIYTRAADLFGSVNMTRRRAMTLLRAASCLEGADDLEEAAMAYDLAEVLGRECGAGRLSDDATRLRTQARERRLPDQGFGPGTAELAMLTNREREIAVAASTGKRTREIAEDLRLSPRTVDVHLTRIYRKLGLTSRAALAKLITELNMVTAETDAPRRQERPVPARSRP